MSRYVISTNGNSWVIVRLINIKLKERLCQTSLNTTHFVYTKNEPKIPKWFPAHVNETAYFLFSILFLYFLYFLITALISKKYDIANVTVEFHYPGVWISNP